MTQLKKSLFIETSFTYKLQEDELRGAVLLVLANKQDLPNAMNVSEITDKLNLSQLNNRQVSIVVVLFLYLIA